MGAYVGACWGCPEFAPGDLVSTQTAGAQAKDEEVVATARQVAATWPPLTSEQRAVLRLALRPAQHSHADSQQ